MSLHPGTLLGADRRLSVGMAYACVRPMAQIQTIPEHEATGAPATLYARLADPLGRVANILKVQSLSPATLEAHYVFYRSLMFGRGPLSRAQRELIAVAARYPLAKPNRRRIPRASRRRGDGAT